MFIKGNKFCFWDFNPPSCLQCRTGVQSVKMAGNARDQHASVRLDSREINARSQVR